MIPPDQRERIEALDPTRSFIVEAPAGSGKTELLVQRFLKLLSGVERPESVVAITFTRKAATEMKERILKAIDDTGLLIDGSRLQVQTIDSLCAMLTRQMPVTSEFGAAMKVVEEAGEFYRRAARDMLRNLTEGDDTDRQLFQRVALHFDNNLARLETQIVIMLQKRDQWESLRPQPEDPQLVADFCELLRRARLSLREVFRESGTVDFSEVASAARKALGTPEQPTDLLFSLDYRIEHLLVDEFQDTSRAQYELLKALTGQWSEGDNHTLFLVGDPMQSIYRFRQAEVGLFLRCWHKKQLGAVRLQPLRLTTNFRSTSLILEWIERKFAPIMAEDDESTGAIKFRKSVAGRGSGEVEPRLVAFVGDDGKQEAAQIVRIIKDSKRRRDIAILVRSRAHIVEILPALREAGIPYQAIEIDALKEQQHIIDLISLTRAILHLGDRVSWLAVLRAPWCGLTLADLSALAEGQPQRGIFDLLSDPVRIAALTPDGRARALRMQEILRAAIEQVGHLRLRDLIENTWLALGGPAILQKTNEREDAQTYFGLLEQVEEGGVIRDFSLLDQRLEFLYAKPASNDSNVQVMTIHQAKGLEFDTVIIPRLGKATRPSESELLVWTEEILPDDSSEFLLAAQPKLGEKEDNYDLVCEQAKAKDAEETKRLFYVGCTRAKNELYVLGNAETKKDGASCIKPHRTTFLGLIWDSVREEFESLLRHRIPVQADLFAAEQKTGPSLLCRLPADWRAPRLDASVEWHPQLQRATASARAITYEWVSDTSRHVGTVVHELLKRIAREGLDHWGTARLEGLAPVVRTELLRLGVARSAERKASSQVLRGLQNILASERGRWALSAHSESHSEWPVSGCIQDRLIHGTIDRIFRDEKGRLWIIDFKNSEHTGAKLESFLNEEQRRYRTQLESYATLLLREAQGPIWLGLYFPLLDGWREWEFMEEAALTAHYTGE